MKSEDLERIVIEAAVETGSGKKLPCKKAFEIAGAHSVPLIEIGKCCNRAGIKISGCQLGCFK